MDPGTFEASIFFPGQAGRPFIVSDVDVKNTAGHDALIRQVCKLAGATSPPAEAALSISAYPPQADSWPRYVKGAELMTYISTAVMHGSFGGRLGRSVLLSACEEDVSHPIRPETKASALASIKDDRTKDDEEGSNYVAMRPHLIVWTDSMTQAVRTVQLHGSKKDDKDGGKENKASSVIPADPSELNGLWVLESHAKAIKDLAATVRLVGVVSPCDFLRDWCTQAISTL